GSELKVYHYMDGWEEVETSVVSETNSTMTVMANATSLSYFAVVTEESGSMQNGGDGDGQMDGNESGNGNGTGTGTGDGGSQDIPGFTVVVALVAIAVTVVARKYRG
ncbi:MAG: hypothetical protein SXQ77_12590, partial [Halobacteria archaeon]|nr:hypothetical protein [Halobacteria archaeon]